mmetsp:Transcript_46341/g.51806  ORF Transcript_46341/g.51806 Transcript_46341/m.51806 type:complete len:96 (+) Transcript_46341:212-499(+)
MNIVIRQELNCGCYKATHFGFCATESTTLSPKITTVLSSGEYGKPLPNTAENISSKSHQSIPLWRFRFRPRTPIKHVLEMNGTTNKNDRWDRHVP